MEISHCTDDTVRVAARCGTPDFHYDFLVTADLTQPSIRHDITQLLRNHSPHWLFLTTSAFDSPLSCYALQHTEMGKQLVVILQGDARASVQWHHLVAADNTFAASAPDVNFITTSPHVRDALRNHGTNVGTDGRWTWAFATSLTHGVSVHQAFPEMASGPEEEPPSDHTEAGKQYKCIGCK